MEDDELSELLTALEEFNSCDHDWVPDPDVDPRVDGSQVCTKCGGGQMPVTEEEFTAFQRVLEDGRA